MRIIATQVKQNTLHFIDKKAEAQRSQANRWRGGRDRSLRFWVHIMCHVFFLPRATRVPHQSHCERWPVFPSTAERWTQVNAGERRSCSQLRLCHFWLGHAPETSLPVCTKWRKSWYLPRRLLWGLSKVIHSSSQQIFVEYLLGVRYHSRSRELGRELDASRCPHGAYACKGLLPVPGTNRQQKRGEIPSLLICPWNSRGLCFF